MLSRLVQLNIIIYDMCVYIYIYIALLFSLSLSLALPGSRISPSLPSTLQPLNRFDKQLRVCAAAAGMGAILDG